MQAPLGHFVDLVLRVVSLDQLLTRSGPKVGATYLQVSGVYMDGVIVGPLHLWSQRLATSGFHAVESRN